ncbi:hypothetical protein AURDEDRAFT_114121, partial [Auricularia subglabra TFB-10046 SS5]
MPSHVLIATCTGRGNADHPKQLFIVGPIPETCIEPVASAAGEPELRDDVLDLVYRLANLGRFPFVVLVLPRAGSPRFPWNWISVLHPVVAMEDGEEGKDALLIVSTPSRSWSECSSTAGKRGRGHFLSRRWCSQTETWRVYSAYVLTHRTG